MNRLWILVLMAFPATTFGQSLVYQMVDPPVAVVGQTQTSLLQIAANGASRVTFESVLQPSVEVNMSDDGTNGDRLAADSVYSLQLTLGPYLALLQPNDVFRLFIGYARPYSGSTSPGRYNIFIDVVNSSVPSFTLTQDAPDVQHTDYLVNIRMPAAFPTSVTQTGFPDQRRITSRFYELFPDDVDFLNIIYFPSYFQNRYHYQVRNSVTGIGARIFDTGSQYGSASKLQGISVFPIPSLYDGAETGFQHELGHQWINFLRVAPVVSGIPHWPYSTMASGIMGLSIPPTGQGGSFACQIIPEGTGVRLTPRTEQPVFGDLDLYLMGLLPASQVAEQIVLNDGVYTACAGTLPATSFTRLGVADLIANPSIGPRSPDASAAPKTFRIATVFVTRDNLLPPEAMSLYSFFAQRAELTTEVPIHLAFLKATDKPFALSTRSLGSLISRLPVRGAPPVSIAIPNRGAVSITTAGGTGSVAVGYARVQPTSPDPTPTGLAIFGYRQGGVLVSEAAVPAAPLTQSGRLDVQVGGSTNTGLAIANPNDSPARIDFTFTTPDGSTVSQSFETVPANGQIARFLSEPPFNSGANANGSFTFTSSLPVSAIALRSFLNQRSESLLTTLPVFTPGVSSTAPSVFPHFATGGGWSSQIVLVNPLDQTLTGSIQLVEQGVVTTTEAYTIPPRATWRRLTDASGDSTSTGWIRVTPSNGSQTPGGFLVFSLTAGGTVVSEASVPAINTSAAWRMYARQTGNRGTPGSIQTGVAIANPNASPVSVTLELTTLNGVPSRIGPSLIVPANGQITGFLDELVPGGGEFEGTLRISAASPIAVTGLRGRYNERGDFLITTTAPANELDPPPTGEVLFPHFADNGGYTTQFVLFNPWSGTSTTGTMRFISATGAALAIQVR